MSLDLDNINKLEKGWKIEMTLRWSKLTKCTECTKWTKVDQNKLKWTKWIGQKRMVKVDRI